MAKRKTKHTRTLAKSTDSESPIDYGALVTAIEQAHQNSGFRQIGEDITGFIADSSIMPVRRKAAEPEEFTELILGGYLSGLE